MNSVRHDDRVLIVPLRGNAAALDIMQTEGRTRWANWLRESGVDVLVLDCLRPVLDAHGLDEHRDAGRFLMAFDLLLREAGIGEAIVVHHMGHVEERSRGDSRLRDWPDVEWRLVRQTADPASPRYISDYGRDVDVRESQLTFETATRRLTIADGSRRDASTRAALGDVLAALEATSEPLSVRRIERACASNGHGHTRRAIRDAIAAAIRKQAIVLEPGPKGSHERASVSRVRLMAP